MFRYHGPTGSLPHTIASLAGQPYTRSTVITAVKFLISDQPHSIDPLLKSYIGMCPPFPVSAAASPHTQGLELGGTSYRLAKASDTRKQLSL